MRDICSIYLFQEGEFIGLNELNFFFFKCMKKTFFNKKRQVQVLYKAKEMTKVIRKKNFN